METVDEAAFSYVSTHINDFVLGGYNASESAIAEKARELGHDEIEFAAAVSHAMYNEFSVIG
jgi:hypothetical protein